MSENPWLLPAGIDDVLPEQARRLENLRQRLLDMYDQWGYEVVVPPLIEYLDSLLTGTGSDLELQIFKLTDQLSGRTLGVRADMTQQVARIDAHHIKREAPTRLCYLGTVLHTRPDGFSGSRSPYQVGAELYGHAGPESDAEIICLMLETLRIIGIDDAYIDLGHVGIYRGLAAAAGLNAAQEAQLFDLLQRKALPDMADRLAAWQLSAQDQQRFIALATLNGAADVLPRARQLLHDAPTAVLAAIDNIAAIAAIVQQRLPAISLHFDLAELRGYGYKTGAVFAAFVPGHGQEIARGGRYDDIGQQFGRSRPATGFSTDLRALIAYSRAPLASRTAILAPLLTTDDPQLHTVVAELRAAGERVVYALPQQVGTAQELGCDRCLQQVAERWTVVRLQDAEQNAGES